MPLANIKRRESVPGQVIVKLKHREQKTVNSNCSPQTLFANRDLEL